MNDPGLDLLQWARGSGWILACSLFSLGIAWRLAAIMMLCNCPDLAAARPPEERRSPWESVWRRFFPFPGLLTRAPATHWGGWIFHAGFLLALFLTPFHLPLFRHLLGVAWPVLPISVVEGVTMAAMAGLFAVLVSRVQDPVKRLLSTRADYLAWILTLLPLATGWLASHPPGVSQSMLLALHLLSAELFVALLPFTRLWHMVAIFYTRWRIGVQWGRKGAPS